MKFNKETIQQFELELKEKGYKKSTFPYKSEDYGYWKSFGISYDEDNDRVIQYQIGILIYDFGKYPQNTSEFPISNQFEFLLGSNNKIGRVDLTVSDENISVTHFEEICDNFYNKICKDLLK